MFTYKLTLIIYLSTLLLFLEVVGDTLTRNLKIRGSVTEHLHSWIRSLKTSPVEVVACNCIRNLREKHRAIEVVVKIQLSDFHHLITSSNLVVNKVFAVSTID